MSFENKNIDENSDGYLDGSEVRKMKKFLKSRDRTKLLLGSLEKNKKLKDTVNPAFERTIKEINNGNSNLSLEEQIVIFRSYKELFGKEFEISDEIKENIKQNMDNLNKTIVSELKSMETIFQKNDKEWFGEIDEDEQQSLLKSEKIVSEKIKKLTEQSSIAKEQGVDIGNMQDNLKTRNQQYTKMLVGVGDKYEGVGAVFAKLKQERLKETVSALIDSMDSDQTIDYLASIHKQIDNNNFSLII